MDRLVLMFLMVSAWAVPSQAQLVADTLFTWQGYGQASHCQVQIYATPPDAKRRYIVVLRELADNPGPTVLDDTAYLAEEVGRQFSIDPATAYWVLHWGAFSYPGAADRPRKELFLRASFHRTKTQRLSSPQWRVLTRDELEDYTDRHFR